MTDRKNTSQFPRNSFQHDVFLKADSVEHQFELLYTMFDRIGDEVMLVRSDGRIAYVNEASVKALGHSREYLINRLITEFHKEKITLNEWKKEFLSVLQKSREPINFTVDRIGKGKKIQTISVTAVCISFQEEDLILAVARDISSQVALEKRLRESEELYRILSDGAADSIVTSDLVGKITYVNKAGSDLLKKLPVHIVGTHFSEYVEKKSLAKAFKVFYAARQGMTSIHEELDVIDAQGNVTPVDIHVTPLYKSGKIFQLHAVVRDISRRKEFERLQRETEKAQAMTHFVSGTVQQVQYPLLAVLESLQRLLKTYKERDFEYIGFKDFKDIMTSLQHITDKIQHCHDTTSRLLTISEKRLGLKKKDCNVNQIIREAVKLMDARYLQSKVDIQLKLSAKDPLVSISEVEMTQILMNILTNAIQAMPAGGTITVKTMRDDIHKKMILTIQDQGIGIKKEHLSRIFEPFFTTKQLGAEKSSGLGLSIVYAVVHARQGRIDIKSSLRDGTFVKVEFPLAR